MKRIITLVFSLMFSLFISTYSYAALTAGTIPVAKSGGSSPTLQNSDILDQSNYISMFSGLFYCNNSGVCAVGTTSPAGIFDITSTTSGFLPPRMTTAQKNAIVEPVAGMVVYDTTLNSLSVFNNSVWATASFTVGSGLSYTGGELSLGLNYVKVSETETSGTAGGEATINTWTTRVLNTKDSDTGSIASLGSNQVTLPAGTYIFKGSAPFVQTQATQLRLQNITTAATLLTGNAIIFNNATQGGYVLISGSFTLASPSALAIQYYCGQAQNTTDLGSAGSYGIEVYTVAEFTKIS